MKVPVYPHPCQHLLLYCLAFLMLGGPSRKDSISSAGDVRDVGLISGSGRSLGVGNGNLLQYSCLENYMGRGAWQAAVHKVAKSWT